MLIIFKVKKQDVVLLVQLLNRWLHIFFKHFVMMENSKLSPSGSKAA